MNNKTWSQKLSRPQLFDASIAIQDWIDDEKNGLSDW